MEVFNDSEMTRILAIPRRPQEWSPSQEQEAVRLLTQHLKTLNGTMTLKPIQARAIVELHDTGTLFGRLGAGAGKTLLSFLAATILEAKRTLLVVPAALREKTHDDWQDLRMHWRIPPLLGHESPSQDGPIIRLISYESLSTINYASYIDEYAPDLVVDDEAHFLSRMSSGRTKRVMRYIRAQRKKGNKVIFVPMSGTFDNKSIRESAHLMEAALGEYSPVPKEYVSLEQWHFATAEGVGHEQRLEPGALLRLCNTDEASAGLDGVRRAIRRRILETPGVVASSTVSCGLPLVIQQRAITPPAEVRTAMAQLRREYMLPTGEDVEKGITFWNHARQIANGFCYRQDPPPPTEWREARSAWTRFVNTALKEPKMDTPLQVWKAVEAGKYGPVPEHDAWVAIRHTFTPKTVPTWISPYLVKDAEAWAVATGGIVWVGHTTAYLEGGDASENDVGKMFDSIPFFAGGDERIKTYKGPCAASISAHGTGKNLTQWNRALILGFPSSGKTIEQLLARHHRERQKADIVSFEFYCHSLENLNAIKTCLGDAQYQEAITGQPQRILTASLLDPEGHNLNLDHIGDPADPMWE